MEPSDTAQGFPAAPPLGAGGDLAAGSPGKPTISRKAVNWEAHLASAAAREKAAGKGIDEDSKLALISASTASDVSRPPITLGSLWAMEASEPHLAELAGSSRYADQALVVHTLHHPEETLLAILSGDLDPIRQGMIEAAKLPASTTAQIDLWFAEEMRRIKRITSSLGSREGDGKKPKPAGGFKPSPPSEPPPA